MWQPNTASRQILPLPVTPAISWLEIGVSQMSGNILMILKVKLTIETDNRATIGVHPEVIFS